MSDVADIIRYCHAVARQAEALRVLAGAPGTAMGRYQDAIGRTTDPETLRVLMADVIKEARDLMAPDPATPEEMMAWLDQRSAALKEAEGNVDLMRHE